MKRLIGFLTVAAALAAIVLTFTQPGTADPVAGHRITMTSDDVPVLWPARGQVYYVCSATGSATATGRSPVTPLTTIEAAINKCTASRGDVILVLPGHNEGGSAVIFDADIAGISIIGIGSGSLRPTIDFDNAAATVDIGANDITIKNLVFRPSVTAVLIGVDIETGITGCTIEDCEFAIGEDGAGVDEFVKAIHLTSGNDDTTIRNVTLRSHASAAGSTHGVHIDAASHRLVLDGLRVMGPWATAGILEDAAGTGHIVKNCAFDGSAIQNGMHASSTYVECRNNLPARSEGGGFIWYVDSEKGAAGNSGHTPETALSTIGAARTLNSATISWALDAYPMNEIRVLPGVYAETVTGLYYVKLKGWGVRGTDGEAEIHHATASAIAGTLLDCIVEDMRLESNTQDVPIVDAGVCNGATFRRCTFALGANVSGVAGIDTENSTHLTVEDCHFESGQPQSLAYGLYHRGGADKYLHQARIRRNVIFAATAGVYIAADCTASGAVIQDNFIGPNACLKGVDDNNGNSYVIGNRITAQDAIEHANSATQCIDNAVINNATGAKEASGT